MHPRFRIFSPVDFCPEVKVGEMQQPHFCHLPISLASSLSPEEPIAIIARSKGWSLTQAKAVFKRLGIVLNFKAQKGEPA